MIEFRKLCCAIALFAALGSAAKAQETLPEGPFKTVHLMIVTPLQESFLIAAVSDFNREFAKQGCSTCVYRVFKMVAGKANKYNYMVTADWPGQAVYLQVHGSPGYGAATKKNPIMNELSHEEFYGRYVELK